VLVVGVVDDRGDAAHWAAIARGDEGENFSVDALEGRVGPEEFRDASREWRDERGITAMKKFGNFFKPASPGGIRRAGKAQIHKPFS
jgi:hypothetical protein